MIRTLYVNSLFLPEDMRPVFVEVEYQDEQWMADARRGIWRAVQRLGLEMLKREKRARDDQEILRVRRSGVYQ